MDSSIRSLLCEDCWAGPYTFENFRRLMSQRWVYYRTTLTRVQKAATEGCQLCKIVYDNTETLVEGAGIEVQLLLATREPLYLPDPSAEIPDPTADMSPGKTVQFLQVVVEDIASGATELNDANGYYLRTTQDDPAVEGIVARGHFREVGSPLAYQLASAYLNECLSSHTYCPKPNKNSRLPTRVIDCLNPNRPRLFVSNNFCAPYVALSYVWGGVQPHSMTTANIEEYIQGIDPRLIPQTIREAIGVTNKFGVRYLWVDAYCIVQDSREDKNVELTQLRRVFRDAFFTIIASAADSASAGFLHDRSSSSSSFQSPSNMPLRLPYLCADGQRTGTMTAELIRDPRLQGLTEPADQRAWCLEERLLSARKLVYTADTLQYDCLTAVSPIGGDPGMSFRRDRLPRVMFMRDEEISGHVARWDRKTWLKIRDYWQTILGAYTERAVTKSSDKLTALAGVAEMFGRVLPLYPDFCQPKAEPESGQSQPAALSARKNGYLAGLWEQFLPAELLWDQAYQHNPPQPRPSTYRAPSWSWASVDGRIYVTLDSSLLAPDAYPELRYCDVLGCDVVLEDARLPHGRVRDGWLRLRAAMVPTTWATDLHEYECGPDSGMTLGLFVRKDDVKGGVIMRCVPAEWRSDEGQDGDDGSLVRVADAFVDSTEEVQGRVWAVPVAWNSDPSIMTAGGLLVTRANDVQCRRVGSWKNSEELVTELDSLGDPIEMPPNPLKLAWWDPADLHVIDLI